jgi:hypothetical protein
MSMFSGTGGGEKSGSTTSGLLLPRRSMWARKRHCFNVNAVGRLSEMRQHATQQDKNGCYCSDRSFGH